MNPYSLIEALIFVFFAITFLQSGIDKILNTKDNLTWFQSQFEKTFLARFISPSFWLITIQEIVLAGWMIYATYLTLTDCHHSIAPIWGIAFTLILLIQLFAGQRIAKDYVGAAGIIPYIIVAILAAFLKSSICSC